MSDISDDMLHTAADTLAEFTAEHLQEHVSATNVKIAEVAVEIVRHFGFKLPMTGQRELFHVVHKAFITMLTEQAKRASDAADIDAAKITELDDWLERNK